MYDNIHVGSEVDVFRKSGELLRGKVKWKGSIACRKGEWIGLELSQPGTIHVMILSLSL
jgi:CAP-Gly domain.